MEEKLITITSTVCKKGIPDSRNFTATVAELDSTAIFVLDKVHTHRAISRMRFTLGPDCLIKLDDRIYKVIKVNYCESPNVPIIEAAKIA